MTIELKLCAYIQQSFCYSPLFSNNKNTHFTLFFNNFGTYVAVLDGEIMYFSSNTIKIQILLETVTQFEVQ